MLKAQLPRPALLQTVVLPQYDAADISSGSQILTTSISEDGSRILTCYEDTGRSKTIWKANRQQEGLSQAPQVTSLVPLDFDFIVGGYCM